MAVAVRDTVVESGSPVVVLAQVDVLYFEFVDAWEFLREPSWMSLYLPARSLTRPGKDDSRPVRGEAMGVPAEESGLVGSAETFVDRFGRAVIVSSRSSSAACGCALA